MWTQVQNPRRFRDHEVNKVVRGGMTMTLHRYQANGWILKEYSGKFFVLGPLVWPSIRRAWNDMI